MQLRLALFVCVCAALTSLYNSKMRKYLSGKSEQNPIVHFKNLTIPRRFLRLYEEYEGKCIPFFMNATEIQIRRWQDKILFQLMIPKLNDAYAFELIVQVNNFTLDIPEGITYEVCIMHNGDKRRNCVEWKYTVSLQDIVFNITQLILEYQSFKIDCYLLFTARSVQDSFAIAGVDMQLFLFVIKEQKIKCEHVTSRKKRDIFLPGNFCQRLPLEVDFQEIGWDWIMFPKKYTAYVCNGSCLIPDIMSADSTNHAVIQSLYDTLYKMALEPTCAASKTNPISVITHEDGNVLFNLYTDMVVERCSCF